MSPKGQWERAKHFCGESVHSLGFARLQFSQCRVYVLEAEWAGVHVSSSLPVVEADRVKHEFFGVLRRLLVSKDVLFLEEGKKPPCRIMAGLLAMELSAGRTALMSRWPMAPQTRSTWLRDLYRWGWWR